MCIVMQRYKCITRGMIELNLESETVKPKTCHSSYSCCAFRQSWIFLFKSFAIAYTTSYFLWTFAYRLSNSLFRRDGNNEGGCKLVFGRNKVIVKRLANFDSDSTETMWIELVSFKKKWCIIFPYISL